MPLVAVEGNSKLCSIANDSVPALGVNDENMLRRYVYMFRTSLFSDHTYSFSFFYTFVVLERIHGVCHMSFIACSVEAGRVHVFDDVSATFEVRSFKSIHIYIKTHNKSI